MTVQSHIKVRGFHDLADEAVISLLVASGYVYAQFGAICDQYGITHDQFNVLRILRGVYPDGHPRYEIIQRLINKAPDVTRLLDRLERAGYVERVRSEADRRLSISRITKAGLTLLNDIEPHRLAMHKRVTSRMTDADKRELARLCSLIVP